MSYEDKKPREQVKAHCPECGPGRWADIVAEHKEHNSHGLVWDQMNYRVLRCAGCRSVYFQEVYVFLEDYEHMYDDATGEDDIEYNERITYWPSPSRRKQPE